MTTAQSTVLDVLTGPQNRNDRDVVAEHRSAFPLNRTAMDDVEDPTKDMNDRKRLTALYRAIASCDLQVSGWTKSMNCHDSDHADVTLTVGLDRSGTMKQNQELWITTNRNTVGPDTLRLLQGLLAEHGIPSMVTMQHQLLCAPRWRRRDEPLSRTLDYDTYRWLELGYGVVPFNASDDAYEYVSALMFPGSPLVNGGSSDVHSWTGQPMSAADARTVLEHGVSYAYRAAEMIKKGLTAMEAVQWVSIPHLSVTEAQQWRAAGHSAKDTAFWMSVLPTSENRYAARRITSDVAYNRLRGLTDRLSDSQTRNLIAAALREDVNVRLSVLVDWASMLTTHDMLNVICEACSGPRSLDDFETLIGRIMQTCTERSATLIASSLVLMLDRKMSDDEIVQWFSLLERKSLSYSSRSWITSGWTSTEADEWTAIMDDDSDVSPNALFRWKTLLDARTVSKHQILAAENQRISARDYATVAAIMEMQR